MNRDKAWGHRMEKEAEKWLEHVAGYRVVQRNYHAPGGEIDLVCQDGDEYVMVEVKARRSHRYGDGREAMTEAKRTKILRAVEHYFKDFTQIPYFRLELLVWEGQGWERILVE